MIEWISEDLPAPAAGEVLIEQSAIGLNFIDTYHRTGLYPVPLPSGLGLEAAGTITAVGEGVEDFKVGDRAAYMGPGKDGLGAYATRRIMPVAGLFKLPDDVPSDIAAAALLKAATVEGLVERCAKVQTGDWVLVHAAAGGVGLIMVQWLKAIGANIIAAASTDAKLELARKAGAHHTILSGADDLAEQVQELTGGTGVSVVFDGVGKDTFEVSLDCLASRGLLVSFGNASGPVEGVNLGVLASKGSLFVTRPTLGHYYATPEDAAAGIARVWDMIGSGKVKVTIGAAYPLSEAANAHRDLVARKTIGSVILLP